MGAKLSFLFELRPEDSVYDGFLLPESQVSARKISANFLLENFLTT